MQTVSERERNANTQNLGENRGSAGSNGARQRARWRNCGELNRSERRRHRRQDAEGGRGRVSGKSVLEPADAAGLLRMRAG